MKHLWKISLYRSSASVQHNTSLLNLLHNTYIERADFNFLTISPSRCISTERSVVKQEIQKPHFRSARGKASLGTAEWWFECKVAKTRICKVLQEWFNIIKKKKVHIAQWTKANKTLLLHPNQSNNFNIILSTRFEVCPRQGYHQQKVSSHSDASYAHSIVMAKATRDYSC